MTICHKRLHMNTPTQLNPARDPTDTPRHLMEYLGHRETIFSRFVWSIRATEWCMITESTLKSRLHYTTERLIAPELKREIILLGETLTLSKQTSTLRSDMRRTLPGVYDVEPHWESTKTNKSYLIIFFINVVLNDTWCILSSEMPIRTEAGAIFA